MSDRYKVEMSSTSGHCCFDSTVVDTQHPTVHNGVPYEREGVQQYESICECFGAEDAEKVAEALNLAEEFKENTNE